MQLCRKDIITAKAFACKTQKENLKTRTLHPNKEAKESLALM
jgi:hypothetical protein